MHQLIKPKKLNPGDTIATISLSGGRAGDPDMIERYLFGKRQLEEHFGVHVIEAPHSLKGTDFLYENPKLRADDLIWALTNPRIKGIFVNSGGDDGGRLLPYIDFNIIRNNPKILLGYSDVSVFHAMFTHAGVSSFYGANLLATIAQPGGLDDYTERWIKKALFSENVMGEIAPCDKWADIEWDKTKKSVWVQNTGYELLQGSGRVRGRLLGGCCGSLLQIMGTEIFPDKKLWKDSILFLDIGTPYGVEVATLHQIRAFASEGIFRQAGGLICTGMHESDKEILLKVIQQEEDLPDLPILYNADIGHRIPMTVIPMGALAEIDCNNNTFSILEAGVRA